MRTAAVSTLLAKHNEEKRDEGAGTESESRRGKLQQWTYQFQTAVSSGLLLAARDVNRQRPPEFANGRFAVETL